MSTEATTPQDEYTPPTVWKPADEMGGTFGSINRPTAGSRTEKELPKGQHPLQLYSMGTPNGQKVTILLEELLAAGHSGAEYDAHYVDIFTGDQFTSGFVALNPNSKIPALLDATSDTNLFESGSILLYLSEKFENAFCPAAQRAQVLNWLFWQMGSAPYLGGGFGHFYAYAPYKMKYPIDRFTMETKRQLDVLEQHLKVSGNKYIVGDDFTIADMAIFPWYGQLVLGKSYKNAETFLNVAEDYPTLIRWAKDVDSRPAVQRGLLVNRKDYVQDRHCAADIDTVLAAEDEKKRKAEAEAEPSNKQSKL